MDRFPITGRVDMFPSTYDTNPINSTHVETVLLFSHKKSDGHIETVEEASGEKKVTVTSFI